MASLLDRPTIWEASRVGLDWAFGLYRKRIELLRAWGVLDGRPSVLDLGCGIGQFACVTQGEYFGVDLNCRYVEHARRRRGAPGRSFRCMDAVLLAEEERTFDVVLMVDFLHHLPDERCLRLLHLGSRLARRHVVSLEPVREQRKRLGRWFVEHDRGTHIRPLAALHALFEQAGLAVERSQELRLGPIGTQAILCRPPPAIGLGGRGHGSETVLLDDSRRRAIR